jgi:hypothetical protein
MNLVTKSSNVTALALVLSSSLIVTGAYWDFWWHLHFGRDSFWLPPHILIYSMLACLVIVNAYELVRSRDVLTGTNLVVFVGVVGMIASAIWDDQWHRIHGPDNLNFSLASLRTISPPHAFAVVSGLILGIGVLLRLVARYDNERTIFNSLLLSTYYSYGLAAVLFGSIVFVPSSVDMDSRLLGSMTFSFFIASFAIGTSRHLRSCLVVVQSMLVAGILQTVATRNLAYSAMFGVAGVGFVAIVLGTGYKNRTSMMLGASFVSGSALVAYTLVAYSHLILGVGVWSWLVLFQWGIAALAGGLGALAGSHSMIPKIKVPTTISERLSTIHFPNRPTEKPTT